MERPRVPLRRIDIRRRILTWLAASGVGLGAASSAFSQMRGDHGGQGMMGWGYGWGWFGGVVMALLCLAVIIGLVALIRWLWKAGSRGTAGSDPSLLEILKRRYAQGEISRDEFEQKKKDLGL
jgi:putative membrane protein